MEMETRKSVMSSVNPLFFRTRFYYKSIHRAKRTNNETVKGERKRNVKKNLRNG